MQVTEKKRLDYVDSFMCQAAFSYFKQILDYIHTSIQHDISNHCKKRLDYVDTLICHAVFSHFKKTCYAALITIKRELVIFIRLCSMFGFITVEMVETVYLVLLVIHLISKHYLSRHRNTTTSPRWAHA